MEKNENQTSGFVFQKSYWEAIEELDKDNPTLKHEITFAIIEYGSTGIIDWEKLSPITRCVMKLITPLITKQRESYEKRKAAGRRGGRPKNENQNESDREPNENQNESNREPNENQNGSEVKPNQNLIYNNDININNNDINNDIVCNNNTAKIKIAEETHTQIFNSFFSLVKDYYPAEEKSQQYAKQLADDFINYNKDKPDTFWRDRFWERYIVRFLENDDTNKRESSAKEKKGGIKRFSYQEYCAAITPPTKKYDKEDFETITDNEGKTWWVLKQ